MTEKATAEAANIAERPDAAARTCNEPPTRVPSEDRTLASSGVQRPAQHVQHAWTGRKREDDGSAKEVGETGTVCHNALQDAYSSQG